MIFFLLFFQAADTDMENEHPLPLFEDDATIF